MGKLRKDFFNKGQQKITQFELKSDIEFPEVYFLYLNKNDNKEERITFFADKGITEINTTLKVLLLSQK